MRINKLLNPVNESSFAYTESDIEVSNHEIKTDDIVLYVARITLRVKSSVRTQRVEFEATSTRDIAIAKHCARKDLEAFAKEVTILSNKLNSIK